MRERRMSRVPLLAIMLFILFFLSIASSLPHTYDRSTTEEVENCSTRRIITKRGVLCGRVKDLVVKQRDITDYQFLRHVEQYLGIPYASPPVGELRFMPPGSAPKWSGTKMAMKFGPVCPQKFPDTRKMRPERKKYFEDLQKYLEDQSEDCLYLNVYAPFQESPCRLPSLGTGSKAHNVDFPSTTVLLDEIDRPDPCSCYLVKGLVSEAVTISGVY